MSTDPRPLLSPDYAGGNIMYRRPDLYDAMTAGDDQAAAVARIVAASGATVSTVLDLGCGTGRDLENWRTRHRWAGIGVELLGALIDHARTVRPLLDIRAEDIRTVRLGRTADLITCLGNTLSYLHTDADLTAALATFAAHSHPGTLLIIHTLTEPLPEPTGPPRRHRVDLAGIHAEVISGSTWDASTRMLTTRRIWTHDNGAHTIDHMTRRVTPAAELASLLRAAGFAPEPCAPDGPMVARYLSESWSQ